jgi:hypothetical protein
MLSLKQHLDGAKQRVASRKDIKALRNKAAAEQRAIRKKKPEDIKRATNDRRIERVHARISENENSFSILNTEVDESNICNDTDDNNNKSSFEEKINRDAANYEVSEK